MTVLAVQMAIFCFLHKGWDFVDLKFYRGQVPKFVLETALAVSEGMRRTDHVHRFEIDLFGTESQIKSHAGNFDPFLVLNVDGYRLWLEVWDEPGFGKERTV